MKSVEFWKQINTDKKGKMIYINVILIKKGLIDVSSVNKMLFI